MLATAPSGFSIVIVIVRVRRLVAFCQAPEDFYVRYRQHCVCNKAGSYTCSTTLGFPVPTGPANSEGIFNGTRTRGSCPVAPLIRVGEARVPHHDNRRECNGIKIS
jgi:hypothetical protein